MQAIIYIITGFISHYIPSNVINPLRGKWLLSLKYLIKNTLLNEGED